MPRKQRFKPSRKPKQPQSAEVIEAVPMSEPQRSAQIEDIETSQVARSQQDTAAIIEDTTGGLDGV